MGQVIDNALCASNTDADATIGVINDARNQIGHTHSDGNCLFRQLAHAARASMKMTMVHV